MMQTKQVAAPIADLMVGMLGLAAAMGIGRFAFTPLMPLMQAQSGLTVAQGGWLAAANYAGYLAGALLWMLANPNPVIATRAGLVGVALLTLAMGLTGDFAWWLVWRFVAGIASGFVLVGISAWILPRLARAGRPHWAGWTFAGVGVGIAFAGILSLVIGIYGARPALGWLLLGAIAAVVLVMTWARFSKSPVASTTNAPVSTRRFDADAWLLIGCYGIFGFGYIIPATFLPALARELIADPSIFGWIWPVFGVAAAVSTIAASLMLRKVASRSVWATCQVVMAVGVAAPVVASNVGVLLVSALAIGGTFMIVTMAGMQEARRVAGNAAPRLIAAMTAAFAFGQLLGPIVVGTFASHENALFVPSLAAAALLIASAAALLPRSYFRREARALSNARNRYGSAAGPHATACTRDDG
jgi:MFS family permease